MVDDDDEGNYVEEIGIWSIEKRATEIDEA